MSESPTLRLPAATNDGFASLRRPARAHYLEHGLPTRRDEYYKYTDLSALARQEWPRAPRSVSPPKLPEALGKRWLWVDGHPAENDNTGALVREIRDCAASPPAQLNALLGRLAPIEDPVVALNTALFDHGAWICLPADTAPEKPLELSYASGERNTAAATHARLAVELGPHARLVLIERHTGTSADTLATRIAEISLAPGAELLHLRLNMAGNGTRLLEHTTLQAAEGARYRCLNLDFGARLSRESFVIALNGDRSETILHGLCLLTGKQQADTDVRVVHDALHTHSRQVFRGVLDGSSRGVYSGRVTVQPGAQKTVSDQTSANLLLSRRAEADTRPQLEIYADDVICNHGAATGAIDPNAMFYLQSCGLGVETARHMLAYGFATQVLNGFELPAELYRRLSRLLAGHMQAPPEVLEWL